MILKTSQARLKHIPGREGVVQQHVDVILTSRYDIVTLDKRKIQFEKKNQNMIEIYLETNQIYK